MQAKTALIAYFTYAGMRTSEKLSRDCVIGLGMCGGRREIPRMTFAHGRVPTHTGPEIILVCGCENVAGKLRQKWQATAGTNFTKPYWAQNYYFPWVA